MKKALLTVPLVLLVYVGLYLAFGRVVHPDRFLSKVLGNFFYPVRLAVSQTRPSETFVEQGILRRSTDGEWGLSFLKTKTDPNGTRYQGVAFAIPARLLGAVEKNAGIPVEVAIRKEPEAGMVGYKKYVLHSVTPLPKTVSDEPEPTPASPAPSPRP